MSPKELWSLLKETFKEWNDDDAMRLSAALSYYTIFSLAPLLVIIIAIAGLVFGQEAAQGRIVAEVEGLVGQQGAEAIQMMIANASRAGGGLIATIIGVVTLLAGAAGVFIQLQNSLNEIWEVEPKPGGGLLSMVKGRLFSFAIVLGIGFLLLVSLVLSAGLNAFSDLLSQALPLPGFFWQIVHFAFSFAIITLLFALIYQYLPDVEIAWRDVWMGAAITALLFVIGKFLIGLYLGHSSVGSAYGAAGSLAVLLIWIYYSAMIMFLGAEFTQVYARRYGGHIRPAENAMRVVEQPKQLVEDGADTGTGSGPVAHSEADSRPVTAPAPVALPKPRPPRKAPLLPVVGAFFVGLMLGRRG